MSCPSCGQKLPGGVERCPSCGAMVAPVVQGALAPDPLANMLPGRGKVDPLLRDLPGLRRKERTWKDEVRERVRRRKRKKSGDADLPLFEETADAALEPAPGASEAEVSAAPADTPSAFRDEPASPFEARVLERTDPLDSLADLPLRAREAQVSRPALAEPDEAAREFDVGSEEPTAVDEGDDGWGVEPPPRIVEERPVERPAQALERAQAAAVDAVLLGALGAVVVYFASRFAHVPIEGLRPTWTYLAGYLAFLALVYAVYFTGTTGQTLGKIVYGLRVVDTAGRPPGYLRACGRATLGALGVLMAGLGLIPVLFDPARRAFHDRILRTRVIVIKG